MNRSPFMSVSDRDGAAHANASDYLRLFCFPYAGGNAAAFRTWRKVLPRNVEVCAVQLPGRANRLRDPVPSSFAQLIDDLLPDLIGKLDCGFALFGHSMGAIVAFEAARALRRYRLPMPVHLFLSGHRAPQVPSERNPLHTGSDENLIAVVRRLGGMPAELLENPELLQLVLPTLRADFRLCETYKCVSEPMLQTPVTVFGGADDPETTRAGLEAWREHTAGVFRLHILPGNHFFVHSAESALLERIGAELSLAAPAAL